MQIPNLILWEILARQLYHGEQAKRARIAKQSGCERRKRFPGVGEQ